MGCKYQRVHYRFRPQFYLPSPSLFCVSASSLFDIKETFPRKVVFPAQRNRSPHPRPVFRIVARPCLSFAFLLAPAPTHTYSPTLCSLSKPRYDRDLLPRNQVPPLVAPQTLWSKTGSPPEPRRPMPQTRTTSKSPSVHVAHVVNGPSQV